MSGTGFSKHHKVIVVGTGFSGLIAAKTYLAIDPNVDILLIDGESSIGGVWSASRIYPGLEYETPTPMMNFSDFDIRKELGLDTWADVTGSQLNEFLICYARKFDLLRRCKLNTQVVKIEKDDKHWAIAVRQTGRTEGETSILTCDKLILATGLNSKPQMPDLDMSKFDGPSFHALEMAKRHGELVADDVNHVTIIGGHKSALEAVGTAAQAGKKVEWLIREGGGPTWMLPARRPDGSSNVKIATKRATKIMQTSVYHTDGWLDRFLHSGRWWLGSWLVAWFWGFMTKQIQQDTYSKSENGRKLKPEPETFFWFAPGGTVLHDRDFETLRLIDEEKLVRVNRAHVVSTAGHSVTLSTGETIQTDAIVFCTGWEPALPPLFANPLANEVGMSIAPTSIPAIERQYWEALDTAAEKQVLEDYPVLRNPPSDVHIPRMDKSPFRHFRAVVPPKLAARGDNSLVFLGNYATGRIQTTAEIYSLWAVAYLEGLMPPSTKAILSDEEAMHEDIAHIEAYRKKRYLNGLSPYRLSIIETPEFDDLMLGDLGVRPDRKAMKIPTGWRGWFGFKGWFAEWFDSYFADDFKGIIEEFLENVEKRGGRSKIIDERTPLVNGMK